jgi:hypothetical protein
LLTIGAAKEARFAFFLGNAEQLKDSRRSFTLSAADIARLNPNTHTCPIFRSQKDAEITKGIYQRVPVLWDEAEGDGNPWGITFRQGLFNMTSDSSLFRNSRRRDELTDPLALYEAKMIHQFDHRWATYAGEGDDSRDMTDAEKEDVNQTVTPRYWVAREEVQRLLADKGWTRNWIFGWRGVARATDERSVIGAIFPAVGAGNSLHLVMPNEKNSAASVGVLSGSMSSLVLDFVARTKLGGINFNFFIPKQLPVLAPSAYTRSDFDKIVPRVLELTFTANDLKCFYNDVLAENSGWDTRPNVNRGQPWRWNPERRAIIRAELDAIYARLYGLTREDLRYILDPTEVMGTDYPSESFRVLKDKEIRHLGEFRTQRLVLAAWDKLEQGEL